MLTWCEVDAEALAHNMRAFRAHLGPAPLLAPAVKSNGYGHGLLIAARAFLRGGADWLCVHSLDEARALRAAGVTAPVYVFGPLGPWELEEAVVLSLRLVTYTQEQVQRLAALRPPRGERVRLHLKVETGNNRQGLPLPELLELAREVARHPHLEVEGLCSHFANVEDTTDHSYAERQLALFHEAHAALCALGLRPRLRHIANSAAALLWPERVMEMARVGVSAYGLWPSKETRGVAAGLWARPLDLRPALTWKARVAQVKRVAEGESVGYGCSFTTTRDSLIAVVPVGYYEGYDRGLSSLAHALIRGRRAPVRGRVCMNMIMVEVTDIPGVCLGDEVVLLGAQGGERVTAEQLAGWAGTINYEVVARIAGHLPRVEATPAPEPATRSI